MKQDVTINFSEFIQGLMRMGTIDSDYIMSQIARFVNEDKTLISGIQSLLLSRLKYSTRNLYKSVKFRASYSVRESQESRTFDERIGGYRTVPKNIGDTTAYLNVQFMMPDELINALLGEGEVQSPVPSIGALTAWIRGKQNLFDTQIKEINRRRMVRNALRLQRETLLGVDSNVSTMFVDPIEEVAESMQERMKKRLKEKHSATKGSEYVFLGTSVTDKGKIKFNYKKESTPLFTRNSREGEINRYIDDMVKKYVEVVVGRINKRELFNTVIDIKADGTEVIKNVGTIAAGSVLSALKGEAGKLLTNAGVTEEMALGLDNLNKIASALNNTAKGRKSPQLAQVRQDMQAASKMASALILRHKSTAYRDAKEQITRFAKSIQEQALNQSRAYRRR